MLTWYIAYLCLLNTATHNGEMTIDRQFTQLNDVLQCFTLSLVTHTLHFDCVGQIDSAWDSNVTQIMVSVEVCARHTGGGGQISIHLHILAWFLIKI